jgi:hypothetical protein
MQSSNNLICFIQASQNVLRFDYITDVARKRAHLNTAIAFANIKSIKQARKRRNKGVRDATVNQPK